jgi:hypothetical protein
VLFPDAPGIGARHEKHGGGPVDHDAARVLDRAAGERAILDVEPKAHETRHEVVKPQGTILAPASVRKPCGHFSISTPVHHALKVTTVRINVATELAFLPAQLGAC